MASAQKPQLGRQLFEKPEALPRTLQTEKAGMERKSAKCRGRAGVDRLEKKEWGKEKRRDAIEETLQIW